MYVCVCVCLCLCVCVCECVCVYVCVCVCDYVLLLDVCVCTVCVFCMYVFVCVCKYRSECLFVCVNVSVKLFGFSVHNLFCVFMMSLCFCVQIGVCFTWEMFECVCCVFLIYFSYKTSICLLILIRCL